MYTIFETLPPFDMEAVKTFGLHAKPTKTNPIGRFGTGLKYAIAVLLRNGAKLTIYSHGHEYKFSTKSIDFREQEFDKIKYKHTNHILRLGRSIELDYTTQLGRDWALWMAFREIYANTLDEGGNVHISDTFDPAKEDYHNTTYIVVQHDEFAKWVDRRDEIFLPQERQLTIDTNVYNATPNKTNHLYYRGMRALDLPKDEPAYFTHNIIAELELTEDRTIKSLHEAKTVIQDVVQTSDDKEFIKAVLTAPKESFESKLDFSYAFGCSDEFKEVLTEVQKKSTLSNYSAGRYYGSYIAPKVPEIECNDTAWEAIKNALSEAEDTLYDRDSQGLRPLNTMDDGAEIKQAYLEAVAKALKRSFNTIQL